VHSLWKAFLGVVRRGIPMNAQAVAPHTERPLLLFFSDARDGRCRRMEGYLAQVLQRGQNHDTFVVHHFDIQSKPVLRERFGVTEVPELIVLTGDGIEGRLPRPQSCAEIRALLAPWLKSGGEPAISG
jgi:hypothetical protein